MFSIRLLLPASLATLLILSSIACQPAGPAGPTGSQLTTHRQTIQDYNQAIAINPNDTDAYFNRGLIYSSKGQNAQAIDDYSKTIALKPTHISAYENRGVCYYRQGQYEQALGDFSTAIKLQPTYAVAYSNRAWAYYRLKDLDQARADVQMCQQLGGKPDPNLIRLLNNANRQPRQSYSYLAMQS